MNNQELNALFQEINKLSNCFDREIALKMANKKYKKSIFYKNTHFSIHRAYMIFNLNGINTLLTLFNSKIFNDLARGDIISIQATLEEFIETFDMTVFNHILDFINNKLTSIQGDASQLQFDLNNLIKEFQHNLK